MALNVRSILALFVAVLGLFAFEVERVEAKHKGGIIIKKCNKWEILVIFKGRKKCVPCGGYGGKKWAIACKGPHKCRRGWVHKGKWCHKKIKVCGKLGKFCCVRGKFKYCKRGLKCRNHHCVKPRCGHLGKRCCKWHRCKGGLKCFKGWCVKHRPVCGLHGKRCCRPWFGKKPCKKGLVCWRKWCVPKYKKKFGGKGGKKDDGDGKKDDGEDDNGSD